MRPLGTSPTVASAQQITWSTSKSKIRNEPPPKSRPQPGCGATQDVKFGLAPRSTVWKGTVCSGWRLFAVAHPWGAGPFPSGPGTPSGGFAEGAVQAVHGRCMSKWLDPAFLCRGVQSGDRTQLGGVVHAVGAYSVFSEGNQTLFCPAVREGDFPWVEAERGLKGAPGGFDFPS